MSIRYFVFRLLLLLFTINMIVNYQVFACVGARPLAMGGAFVGVADDENATYWNPAGLTQIEDIRLTYTPTLYDRDTVNYDDFVSLVSPVLYEDYDFGRVGFSFINSGWKTQVAGITIEDDEKWYWFSYGKKLSCDFMDISLGVNLRNIDYGVKGTLGEITVEDDDSVFGMDVSLFCKWNRLSFGVLWQDINEPEVTLFDVAQSYVSNLRPGISFKPDDKTILSLEMYDVLGESETSNNNLRVGIERWFDLPEEGVSLAARVGGYNINADSKSDKAITGGLGIKFSPEAFAGDNLDCPITFGIDYTCMHWFEAPMETDDFTHMLGFNVSVPFDAFGGNSKPSFESKYLPKRREQPQPQNQYSLQNVSKVKNREIQKREIEQPAQELKKEEKQQIKTKIPEQKKIIPVIVTKEMKRKLYYENIYKKMNNYITTRKIPLKGNADVFFTVREDGRVKNIKVSSTDYGLEEIIEEILADMPYFPNIPEELEASEIDFAIKVIFS